jgi:F-type H+-transporting ATPase subunit b
MQLAPLAPLLPLLAAASGGEEKAPPVIDIDGTVLIQFAIFVVMYFVLKQFLFQPYLKMRAERAERIEGAEARAGEMAKKREALDRDYQSRLETTRAKAEEERLRIQTEARAREGELLAQARSRAQTRVQETQKTIAAQVAAAEGELEKQVEPLAMALAKKLLGREV